MFDVGVAGNVKKRQIKEEKGEWFGQAFEHFIFMEILAYGSYSELDYDIHFWRTKSGLEVDFILGKGEVAIEVKGTSRVDTRDFNALFVFIEEYSPRHAYIVCNEKAKRIHRGITVIPWKEFLHDLWADKIIR